MKSLLAIVSLLSVSFSQASTSYEVTLTNGSGMPVSPGVVYVSRTQAPLSNFGTSATAGFIQLCQTGNPASRITELNGNPSVVTALGTGAPLMPGESRTVLISVENPNQQSLQVEAMYGKTKDVCVVASVGSHSLVALKQHVSPAIVQADQAVATGAFSAPKVVYPNACQMAKDAVSCLRELSHSANGKIHAFAGYLPSVVEYIEEKYGAVDTQTLLLPTSGGVRISVKLNH